jgi:uncharacterized protein YndB with AHSA1/START domain
MNEYGSLIAPGTVRFERVLPGPIERVWAHLTESEARGRWFASGPMELRVGGKVELLFQHTRLTDEPTPERYKATEKGITMLGVVTRCEAPRVLAYTWDESEVTFELAPRGQAVLLVLTHRKLASRAEEIDVSGGWHTHLGVLEDLLRGAPRGPFWSRVFELERAYRERYGDAAGTTEEH